MAKTSDREGFRHWVDRYDDPEWTHLPLTHITKAYVAEDIIKSDAVNPTICSVFNEPIAYFFYGRSAYRANTDLIINLDAACPYCFIFSPKLLRTANKIFPFDTGAFQKRLYSHILIDEMDVHDFSLDNKPERINKLINAAFNNPRNYFDGNRSVVPDPAIGAEAWEMAGRAYLQLLRSPGRNEPDDRICSIEVLFTDPVPLLENLLAVVVPHSHWLDGSGAPWLNTLSTRRVNIIPFNFIPGRNPEYYQTMIESAIKDYYIKNDFIE